MVVTTCKIQVTPTTRKEKNMTYEPDPSDYVKADLEDAAIQDAAERYATAGNPLPELAAIMDIAFGITG